MTTPKRTIHHPGEHQRITDDGVAYCGWAGDGGIYHGCGVFWTPGHDVEARRAGVQAARDESEQS